MECYRPHSAYGGVRGRTAGGQSIRPGSFRPADQSARRTRCSWRNQSVPLRVHAVARREEGETFYDCVAR
jgi:hypothetical protein